MASPTPNESSALLRQNQELRQRLQEESSSYRRRLDTYKQAQSNQSALVSRLQAKVMQYKARCSELENQMNETVPLCPQYSDPSKSMIDSSVLPAICPKSKFSSCSNAPMSLPACPALDIKPGNYCSDESDESFERKRTDEERKLLVKSVRDDLEWLKMIFHFQLWPIDCTKRSITSSIGRVSSHERELNKRFAEVDERLGKFAGWNVVERRRVEIWRRGKRSLETFIVAQFIIRFLSHK